MTFSNHCIQSKTQAELDRFTVNLVASNSDSITSSLTGVALDQLMLSLLGPKWWPLHAHAGSHCRAAEMHVQGHRQGVRGFTGFMWQYSWFATLNTQDCDVPLWLSCLYLIYLEASLEVVKWNLRTQQLWSSFVYTASANSGCGLWEMGVVGMLNPPLKNPAYAPDVHDWQYWSIPSWPFLTH
jgi:hypothetical protein